MSSIVVQFVGGPRDGETMRMPFPPNPRYLVPVMGGVEVYELVYVNGRPSVDDHGGYRYQHKP